MKGKMIFAAAAILCGATAFGTGYYKPADENDLRWDRLDSWYQDNAFTTAATHLPYSNEDVYVSAPYKVTITNGTIAGAHSMYLPSSGSGPAGSADLRIEAGGVLVSVFGIYYVGHSGGHGSLTLDGGMIRCTNSSKHGLQGFYIGHGDGGFGVVTNRNGGSIYTREGTYIGSSANSHGRYVHDGGTWNWAYNGKMFYVGQEGLGEVEVQSGTWKVNCLRLGGSKTNNNIWVASGAKVTTGYPAFIGGFDKNTYRDGWGELTLVGGTFEQTGSDSILYVGSWTGSVVRAVADQQQYGRIRGYGTFARSGSNLIHLHIGRGQAIADGGILDMNAYASCTNAMLSSPGYTIAGQTNGWRAVNGGEARYPRQSFSAANATVGFGTEATATTPDLLNSAVLTVTDAGTATKYLRGGCVAADREGVHAESLPRNYGIIGMWRLGLYTDAGTWGNVSKAAAYGTARLSVRYEASKLDPQHSKVLGLYRWEAGHWVNVGYAGHDSGLPVFTSDEMGSLSGVSENVGLFALLQVRSGTTVIFR